MQKFSGNYDTSCQTIVSDLKRITVNETCKMNLRTVVRAQIPFKLESRKKAAIINKKSFVTLICTALYDQSAKDCNTVSDQAYLKLMG